MTTEGIQEFYRALIIPEHLNRWRRQEFTSFYADNGSWWQTRVVMPFGGIMTTEIFARIHLHQP